MKKRLLITSIVMMLVVAVALSTATYAWFTSNASVTASTVSLTAATNSAAALGIGWANGPAGTAIETTKEDTLNPMCPEALVPGTTLSTVNFKTATIKQEGGVRKFKTVGVDNALVFDDAGSPSAVETFYVSNLSANNKISQITVTADIAVPQSATTGVALVRIAIFKKVSDNYVLVGVLSQDAGANTVVGTPAENKNADPVVSPTQPDTNNPMSYFTGSKAAGVGLALGGLDVSSNHELKVLIWMDGQALDDSKQGVQATVAFTFTAGTSGQNVTILGDQVALDAPAQNP